MRIRTTWGTRDRDRQFERNNGISETKPNDSMSIDEMLRRVAQGLPIMGTVKVPIYEGEDPVFPDFEKLDLAEREDILLAARERLDEVKRQANEKARIMAEKKMSDRLRAAIAAEMTERQKNEPPAPQH